MTNLIQEVKAALQAATPGPWREHHPDAVSDKKGQWICQLYETDTDTDEPVEFDNQQGNVHLIANAPTWLQQLIDHIEVVERQRDEAVKALEWYGDEAQYNYLHDRGGWTPPTTNIADDMGKMARTTLKRIKGENG